MGVFSSMKTAAKNASDRGSEASEKSAQNSKIRSAQKEIDESYAAIGKLYYDNVKNPDAEFAAKSLELVNKIDENLAVIEEAQKAIEEITASHEAAREANKQQQLAEDAERAQRKAEEKAAKAAAKEEESK